jgi:UDP-N-acetylglucosamine diphosphorylase/glucosamine-1-phosphate N-acetyltransferase
VEYRLIEDAAWRRLQPYTWLRPAYELRVGAWTLRERWQRLLGRDRLSFTARSDLKELLQERYGERAGDHRPEAELTLINGCWLPAGDGASVKAVLAGLKAGQGYADGSRALALRPAPPLPPRKLAEIQAALCGGELPGGVEWRDPPAGQKCLSHLWELVAWTEELLDEDLAGRLATPYGEGAVVRGELENADRISLGAGVQIRPGAFLDASEGPIVLEAGCRVAPMTWVKGPLWAGPGCLLLGERIGGGVVLGPECRIHGEIDTTVVLGYSNKAHEGFVGHSYLGEWVNLGALTTTSDLKNNYGMIRLREEGREVPSGRMKLGSFIGDHAKTAIGTLLTTGAVTGVGCQIFGRPGLTPKWIPSFAWGAEPGGERYELERFLETTETVLARRGRSLTPAMRRRLREVYARSAQAEKGA